MSFENLAFPSVFRSAEYFEGRDRTHISWTAKEIVLPTIEGSSVSGAIIKVAGITGRIRGMKFKQSDGMTVRPEFVVLDRSSTRVEKLPFSWEGRLVGQT